MSGKKKAINKNKTLDITMRRKMRLYLGYFYLGTRLLIVGLFIVLFFTRLLSNLKESTIQRIAEFSSEIGFELEHVIIIGQHNLTTNSILSCLNADVGSPLLGIKLKEAKKKLSENSWIKHVSIRRQLPDSIIINLTEREPIAIWQKNRELFVIDREGNIIKDAKAETFAHLLQVIGNDANIYSYQLIEDLKAAPQIAGKVTSAIRFGERRWNLNLQENITVRMPQYGFEKALKFLKKLHEENKLFGQNYKIIDLRDPTKYYTEKY